MTNPTKDQAAGMQHYHSILLGKWPITPSGELESSTHVVPLVVVAHRISGETSKFAIMMTDWIRRSEQIEISWRIGDYLTEDIKLLEDTLNRLPKKARSYWTKQCASIGYISSPSTIADADTRD